MIRVRINLVQQTQCSNMTLMTQQQESLIWVKAWPPNAPGARVTEDNIQQQTPTPENNTQGLGEQMLKDWENNFNPCGLGD